MRLKKDEIIEKIFYIAIGIYFFFSAMTMTMIENISMVDQAAKLMRYVCYFAFVVVITCNIVKGFSIKRFILDYFNYCRKHILLILLLVITVVIYLQMGERIPLIMMLLIWACSFYDFKKIVKVYFGASLSLMILTWGLALMGKIPDIDITRVDKIRYSIGYIYPLETMTFFLFLVISYAYMLGKKYSWKDCIIINMIGMLLYYITEARTSFYLVIAVSFVFLLFAKVDMERIMKKLFPWAGYLVLILCTMVSLLGGIFYDTENTLLVKLNLIISNRFRMMNNAFEQYGFSLFGERIEWVGYGGLVDTTVTGGRYNFVDCSYGKVLLDYGIIFFILVLIGYAFMYHVAAKKKDYTLIIAITIVLVVSIMEPRLISIEMNPFLLLLGWFFCHSNERKKAVQAGGQA